MSSIFITDWMKYGQSFLVCKEKHVTFYLTEALLVRVIDFLEIVYVKTC